VGLIPAPMEVVEGDYLIAASGSGGGLGDPLEREPRWIKADMDQGLSTEWMAKNVYCIQASYDEAAREWKVDEAASKELRDAKRKERLARGVPVKEWWQKGRRRFMARDFHPEIVEMYQSSAKLSQAFAQEVRDFWALPDDFML